MIHRTAVNSYKQWLRGYQKRTPGSDFPALPNVLLQKTTIAKVESDDDSNRVVRFTISTAVEDREKDVIHQDGWMLENYMRNPVVLWAHNDMLLPIARCLRIGVVDEQLVAEADFVPADVPLAGDMAEAILRMLRGGFLSATSVGFRPLKVEVANDRDEEESWFPPLNFIRQELLEFSVCSIPCNPEALIEPDERRSMLDAAALNKLQEETQRLAEAEMARQLAYARRRTLRLACV